ncbi:MAG TPA: bifunctional riboflavin kinase/FAD synthetase [Chitinophagaceae bacterium]|nr:bifunctional riboflavin kinase/FAD synthetase [Chitinophagaceae bacterium]
MPPFKNAVVTIGTFDGVHTGHLKVIHQLKKEAAAVKGETVIITFDPHPRMVINRTFQNANPIRLLTTPGEKTELLGKQNIDHLVIVPFTKQFSEQTADEYIQNFLVNRFHPHTVIIGYDHRFGKDRTGNYKLLEQYGPEFGFKVQEIPGQVLHHIIISSTNIRKALKEHDIQTANACLGYSYFFEGTVVDGNKLGRELGYPTANLKINDENKLVPADGIYAVRVSMPGDSRVHKSPGGIQIAHPTSNIVHYKGMMSIGMRPTVGGTTRVIEVNIFDFNEKIYGEKLRVYVEYFLREEVKFESIDDLKHQIDLDKIHSLKLLGD